MSWDDVAAPTRAPAGGYAAPGLDSEEPAADDEASPAGDRSEAVAPAETRPTFAGFPGRGARYTAVPDLFFSRLLGEIEDAAELRALLFVFWRLRGKQGDGHFVTLSELAGIPAVLGAFGTTVDGARGALRTALESGARRGTLIEVVVAAEGVSEQVYFLNTPADAERARRVREGDLRLRFGPRRVAELPRRPRRYHALWEARLGLLTPDLARQLDAAVAQHGEARVLQVIEAAADSAERPWSYLRSSLERWAAEAQTVYRVDAAEGGRHEEPA